MAPLSVAVALAVAGCGSASAVIAGERTSETGHIACSVAISYTSLAGLRRDASAVALLRPTGETTVRSIDSVPFTIAKVKILKTVAGGALPSTLGLRQLGRAGLTGGDSCTPLVYENDVYLAYLVPYRLRRNGPPISGQYVSVGGAQGLFHHVGASSVWDTSARSFVRLDPDATSLPPRISILDAERS